MSQFARDRQRRDGTAIHCKPCRAAYYAANASTIQQKHKEWSANPENRIKLIEWNSITRDKRFFYRRANNICGSGDSRRNALEVAIEIAKLWKRQRGICPISGRRLSGESAQLDHIIPRKQGGDDSIGNLRWVHRDVNYAKRDLSDDVFLQLCLDVVKHSSAH